jgi:serine/threonine protein kinase
MELCDISLEDYIHRKGNFVDLSSEGDYICTVVTHIVRGLCFIHGVDVVHGNLKPRNSILISKVWLMYSIVSKARREMETYRFCPILEPRP